MDLDSATGEFYLMRVEKAKNPAPKSPPKSTPEAPVEQALRKKIPIVVDLGKPKRKELNALMSGSGPLVDEIQEALKQVQEAVGSDSGNLRPVVLVYKKKKKKKNRLFY